MCKASLVCQTGLEEVNCWGLCWYVVFWSIIVGVGLGFLVRTIGFARISAVFASSCMVSTFIVVASGGVFGGSWASIMRSL